MEVQGLSDFCYTHPLKLRLEFLRLRIVFQMLTQPMDPEIKV